MNPMRNKNRLLARASTLAIIAAAGALGAVEQAQAACTTTLNSGAVTGNFTVGSPFTCVNINGAVTGDVINNNSVGDPGTGFIPFDVTQNIGDQLINNGNITGGYYDDGTQRGALTIRNDATIANGIVNNGLITSTSGNGIQIGTGGENAGFVDGIWNYNSISSGTRYGVAAIRGTLTSGLHNQDGATLNGGLAAIYISDTFTSWEGGIENAGTISGVDGAIVMGDGGEASATTFAGGITNHAGAKISSIGGTAILVNSDIASFSDGITNDGLIQGDNDGIAMFAQSYNGALQNSGDILGGDTAVDFAVGSFHGSVTNTGRIAGSLNSEGGEGRGLIIRSYGDIDGGVETPAEFRNAGTITADLTAVAVVGDNVTANFTNDSIDPVNDVPPGRIVSDDGIGVLLAAHDDWVGNVTNAGTIIGGTIGMVVGATDSEGLNTITDCFHGTITNTGVIAGEDAGLIVTAEEIGHVDHQSHINNQGHISGDVGVLVINDLVFGNKGSFRGTITNGGTIDGADTGLAITVGAFNGTITNDGSIDGQAGVLITATNYTGDFVNNGTITGGNVGVQILGVTSCNNFCNLSEGTFAGNVTNNGYISGADGLVVDFDEIDGDITNNGQIIASTLNTGLHIVAGSMTGNIVNNDYIYAPSNALHVEIGDLDGDITNTGSIVADTGALAVHLEIGNGATFTNTGGGIVDGDILFEGKTSYTFVGENGGLEGDITGETDESDDNDDSILIQNGDHYFVAQSNALAAAYGPLPGVASNFADFTVENGGTAVMGARFVGDTDHSRPYSFSNVDNVNVNNGGVLYVDSSTTLEIDNDYTQQSGGTVMFFLGAPDDESESFSDRTGVIVAGSDDYGQLLIDGTADLDGIVAGYLDPEFANANPGLTEVQYNDVIVATGGIEGDFTTTALISNSSLFELESIIDENTVDLRVVRSSLGSIGAPSVIVNIGDPFDANITDRTNGIGGGCSLAGPGWCFSRYAANEPGATQVMNDATPGEDPFAWLRAGSRQVGETAVWGRGVGVWGETDGDAFRPGSDFSLGGAIVGVDHVFAPEILAGVAFQWTTTDVEFGGATGDADVDSYELGLYGSIGDARLFLNANVSYIWHNFEVNRITGANRANGDYDGSTFSAYVEGGKTFQTDEGVRIQPLVAVSYAHLETDSYSETGTGTLLDVSDAELDTLKSLLGVRIAYPFRTDGGRSIVPEARIIWSHEFMDDHASHFVDVQDMVVNPTLVTGEEFSRDTLVLGVGVTAAIADNTTVFLDYDAGLNQDITSHTISGGVRVRW